MPGDSGAGQPRLPEHVIDERQRAGNFTSNDVLDLFEGDPAHAQDRFHDPRRFLHDLDYKNVRNDVHESVLY